MTTARILAVDDEPHVLELCRDVLEADGYQVDLAVAAGDALERLRRRHYDLVLTDLRMPGRSGIDLLHDARAAAVQVPFVILTGHPSLENAVDAVRQGAEDFLAKPFDTDQLGQVVRRVLAGARPRRERPGRDGHRQGAREPRALLGRSQSLETLRDLIRRAAPTGSNVLILGESGSGKELVARHLHAVSARRGHALVAVDCSSGPDDLIEHEIFGPHRQSFIASVAGGTLFLDELGDLSPAMQSKLVRVLQECSAKGLDGDRAAPADVRVVAATSVDLAAAVRDGRFREDLYFRLNVIPVQVPPLRERVEDIRVLVDAFLTEFSTCRARPPRQVSAAALEVLQRYGWPGNVRELRNTIERLVSLVAAEVIDVSDIPAEIRECSTATPGFRRGATPVDFRQAKRLTVDGFERDYLHGVLSAHGGNVTRSAQESGMKRSAFQRLMRKHRLSSRSYREAAAHGVRG